MLELGPSVCEEQIYTDGHIAGHFGGDKHFMMTWMMLHANSNPNFKAM